MSETTPEPARTDLTFGTELRRRRLAAGMTLSELARRLHYSKGYLSKLESGAKTAGPDLARRCDTALRAQGALLALAHHRRTVPAPADDLEAGIARRDMLIAGAVTIFAGQIPAASAEAVAGADSTVAGFTNLLTDLKTAGQSRPSALILPTLIMQADTLAALAAQGSAASRKRLMLVHSRYCEYIGWMFQESGDERARVWWTKTAVEAATEAGDRQMSAYALVRHANATMYRGDGSTTVELARQAYVLAGEGPAGRRVRLLAKQREAQGHALLLNRGACLRALDEARGIGPSQHESGRLGSTTVADPLDLALGWSLYDLGCPEAAVPALERHLAEVPPTAARARARVTARLALSQVAAGDVDAARRSTDRLITDAQFVHSHTLRQDLERLSLALGRFRKRPEIQDLAVRLTQVRQA